MSAIPSNFDPCLEPAAASDDSIQRVHGRLLSDKPQPEPGGFAYGPLMLLGFMSGLILFCCIYLVHNRGGFDPLVYNGHIDPRAPRPAVALTVPEMVAKGQTLYSQTCVQCHGAAGLGTPGAFPPLARSEWVNGSEERLVRVLLNGLKDPINVKGAPFSSSNKMPNFGLVAGSANHFDYNDAKMANVLTYVRQAFGNASAPVMPEKVAEIRAATADRKSEWTQAELPAQ
ncbi:MAG: cytochrome c [Verrucomicrobiota bacterium]